MRSSERAPKEGKPKSDPPATPAYLKAQVSYGTEAWCDVMRGANDDLRHRCRSACMHGKCGAKTQYDPQDPHRR